MMLSEKKIRNKIIFNFINDMSYFINKYIISITQFNTLKIDYHIIQNKKN
jgi:hypothetical protein